MTKVQTNCPACGSRIRLSRPATKIAAIRCPTCRQLFEVESAGLEEEPIVAEMIEDRPIVAVIVNPAPAKPQPTAAPAFDLDLADSLPKPIRPVLPHKQKKNLKPVSPSAGNHRVVIIGISVAAVLLLGVGTFALMKISGGAFNADEAVKLASQYEAHLESLRTNLNANAINPQPTELDKDYERLQSFLFEVLDLPKMPDSQLAELREAVRELYELQMEDKRIVSRLPISAVRGSKIEHLSPLIELINKQLSYGVCEIPEGSNAVDQFSKQYLLEMRRIDRQLVEAVRGNSKLDLGEVAQTMDQLDQLTRGYSVAASSRTEMSFESQQIRDTSSALQKWCIGQLKQTNQGENLQYLSNELTACNDRLARALNAQHVDRLTVAAIDRLQGKSAEPPTSTIAATTPASTPPTSISSSTNLTTSGNPLANNGSSGMSNVSSPASSSSSGIMPTMHGDLEAAASGTSLTVTSRPGFDSKAAPTTISSPINGSLGRNEEFSFPEPKYSGSSALNIKYITNRSIDELRTISVAMGAKAGGSVDVQQQGRFATVSISNFSGKVYDAIQLLKFGKVEISDSQTRTLFVNDVD